ncbi:MAG: hypothetical protein E6J90_11475 [Deltaproteobacteria bacterium]|nr:MAG: hypothetical protein E6J91_03965 [Deltaproteobacteria bacterium]TMQ22989.1 MAG: hypothetical protein E6J90_11475 [Deltaproteobacteria bacterium]
MRTLFLVLLTACTTGTGASSPVSPAPAGAAPAAPGPAAAIAPDAAFEPLRGLLGRWQGDDPDRHASGWFTLAPDLGGKVLIRHSRNDSPQGHHDDLMIVFATPAGLRASYFDNEGHAIQYAITATADRIELLSDPAAGQPRFRLRYELHGSDELAIDFAIAMPGSADFQHYTGGIVHRVRT